MKNAVLSKKVPEKSKWTWKRWTFISMVTVSFVYLVIVFAGFLQEADTTFAAATQLSDKTLSSMIVHRRPFTAPQDTLIHVPYIHLMERVVRGLDTMRTDAKDYRWNRRKFLADLFNSYSTSIAEYQWMRAQIIRTLRIGAQEGHYVTKNTPRAIHLWLMEPLQPENIFPSDTANIYRLRIAAPFLIQHAAPLVRNLDAEASRSTK
ncbi:MAG: hypothetical protein SGJ05_03870 [bacterium]|nr:hypothetical protein [bacterium]